MIELEEPDPARWREQVHRLVGDFLHILEAHRGIARVAIANIPTGENAMSVAENMMSLLLAGGITPQDAAWACDILPLITTSTAVETATYEERGAAPDSVVEQLAVFFDALSPEKYPHLTRYATELTSGDGDTRFQFAVDAFLDGLVARAQRA
jgi:hypothetical protein